MHCEILIKEPLPPNAVSKQRVSWGDFHKLSFSMLSYFYKVIRGNLFQLNNKFVRVIFKFNLYKTMN